ncbi:hypothetical protein DID76_01555 [Candidatus Marinamargulisbacteria bacterium SCGC AG-414-C22]|nr:hypothetical protein DID76_01555 [Candidatus Marinamargulisbacteria bacterium SCGC AG-414-C22]
MKNKLKIWFSLILIVTSVSMNYSQEKKWSVSVAEDPVTYLYRGYSAMIFFENIDYENWRTGVELFSMDMPDFYIDLHPSNQNEGWSHRVDHGVILYLDYFFENSNLSKSKWHMGSGLSWMKSKLSRNDYQEKAEYNVTEVFYRVGYQWFPFKNSSIFIDPWVTLAWMHPGDHRSIGDETYAVNSIQLISSMHVGFKF